MNAEIKGFFKANKDIYCDNNNNIIMGLSSDCIKGVTFSGQNNIFACEPGVVLGNSNVMFNGDNSVVYLSASKRNYYVNIYICGDSACYIGRNCWFHNFTPYFHLIITEKKHVCIGNNCLFSVGITFRNSDGHLIYNTETLKRTNHAKSIYIGDHVWLGESVFLVKGTQIGSGSIVGAGSLVAGKHIPSNTCYAGNPAKLVRETPHNSPSKKRIKEKRPAKQQIA